ncbi:virulence factor family protein [bacterium]|nr:virulence factor family protein [bacterium]
MINILCFLVLAIHCLFADELKESKYKYGLFGEVTIYQGAGKPKSLILFASGDGGWNEGVVDMAKSITKESTVVAGFNTPLYLQNLAKTSQKCYYPAGDLELLSKFVQQKLDFVQYDHPILLGYSSGATLVYGALAQAPDGTFQGALSLGFCPDLPTKVPLCKGFGLKSEPLAKGKGFNLMPIQRAMSPWAVLHGDQDKVCSLSDVEKFAKNTTAAKLVPLPKVGHGFSVQKNWLPQFQSEVANILKTSMVPEVGADKDLSSLPLVLNSVDSSSGDTFVIFYSGDGGWAEIDREISKAYLQEKVPVVGVNSLKYFWTKKDAQKGAQDLENIIESYSKKWKKTKVVVAGFSFGADVVPFFVSRLSSSKKQMIQKIVLISLAKKADFEFHFTDWIYSQNKGYSVLPEIKKIQNQFPILCLYGEEDKNDSGCTEITGVSGVKSIPFPGGHHLDASIKEIYQAIK